MAAESPLRQLLPPDPGQLFPSLSHLLKLFAMGGRRLARHLAAFGGVLKVVSDFFHEPPIFPCAPGFNCGVALRFRDIMSLLATQARN